MKKDLVSIIIPIYNGEKYIESAINSILSQTYDNYEVIIIDDYSKDNSYNIAKSFQNRKIKVYKNNLEKGLAPARNCGIKKAKGKYIAFLDVDDVWNKDKLLKQVTFMRNNNIPFSYTSYDFIRNNKHKIIKADNISDYKRLLKKCNIIPSSVMIDTYVIPKDIMYMPNILCEDYQTWLNILKKGYKVYGLKVVLTSYYVVEGSLSSNKIKTACGRWRIYRSEGLSLIKCIYYFLSYVLNAIKKRL